MKYKGIFTKQDLQIWVMVQFCCDSSGVDVIVLCPQFWHTSQWHAVAFMEHFLECIDQWWTPFLTEYLLADTMIQHYTITKGKVQNPLFNIAADLKLWVWVWCHYEPILHHNWRHCSETSIQHYSWVQIVGMTMSLIRVLSRSNDLASHHNW